MTNSQILVNVKTMTDYHLESFIRCPYKFYYQHVLALNSTEVKWRQSVQFIINQVIQNYYQLPANARDNLSVLRLIHRYWQRVSPELFESKGHYYMVLAKTTDHLLQFLSLKVQEQPLFLNEKLNTNIKAIETQLSLTIELAEWSNHSFTINKFLLEADKEMIQLYHYIIAVFSNEAFGKLPEKIEIFSLLEGKTYSFSPTMNDVEQGIMYLGYMKDLLKNPNHYSKAGSLTECGSCQFALKCSDAPKRFRGMKLRNIDYLH